jgi:hypothetical protein
LPVERYGGNWVKVLDTASDLMLDESIPASEAAKDSIMIEGYSVVVLKQPKFL